MVFLKTTLLKIQLKLIQKLIEVLNDYQLNCRFLMHPVSIPQRAAHDYYRNTVVFPPIVNTNVAKVPTFTSHPGQSSPCLLYPASPSYPIYPPYPTPPQTPSYPLNTVPMPTNAVLLVNQPPVIQDKNCCCCSTTSKQTGQVIKVCQVGTNLLELGLKLCGVH